MTCVCGFGHTITLSNDGTVHSFGSNYHGTLGLDHFDDVSQFVLIMKVLSFGANNFGQLGRGKTTNFDVPKKILSIPPVISIICGSDHTLIITNDDNLWSWGVNDFGQLCSGDKEDRTRPQKTPFSNISKISTSVVHSLFQNYKGEIFACGTNEFGQCGLGHFKHPQMFM